MKQSTRKTAVFHDAASSNNANKVDWVDTALADVTPEGSRKFDFDVKAAAKPAKK